jgi:hypothetical protein
MDKKVFTLVIAIILFSWMASWISGFCYGVYRGVKISDETYLKIKNEGFINTLIFPTEETFLIQGHEVSKIEKK